MSMAQAYTIQSREGQKWKTRMMKTMHCRRGGQRLVSILSQAPTGGGRRLCSSSGGLAAAAGPGAGASTPSNPAPGCASGQERGCSSRAEGETREGQRGYGSVYSGGGSSTGSTDGGDRRRSRRRPRSSGQGTQDTVGDRLETSAAATRGRGAEWSGDTYPRRHYHALAHGIGGGSRGFSSKSSPALHSEAQASAFVSKHFVLEPEEITEYLDSRGVDYKVVSGEAQLKECPYCHETRGMIDNLWKLYVGLHKGGAFYCHRCGSKGSWFDFKRAMGGISVSSSVSLMGKPRAPLSKASSSSSAARALHKQQRAAGVFPLPDQVAARRYQADLLYNPAYAKVKDELVKGRGLSLEVLIKYGMGAGRFSFAEKDNKYVSTDCYTFPWVMRTEELPHGEVAKANSVLQGAGKEKVLDSVVTRVKARAVANKAWQRLDPAGGRWGLFGYHTVPAEATEVVLTEGEFDAMAVFQATGLPAVSLPSGCRNLPVDVLPLLERFDKVYLWMDNDLPGQDGAHKFVEKLGKRRCLLVTPPPSDPSPAKDANEALLAGKDLMSYIAHSKPVANENVLNFGDLRNEVLNELLNADNFRGVPISSFPSVSRIIKGFRQGEVSVLTGPTGSGKTTLLSQFSLDMAQQGQNTLWGSFEVKNTRLITKMLQQFSLKPLADVISTHPDALSALADRFQELPLFFLNFHGGTDVDAVLDALDYAVYVNDVRHIIVDNLQFMLSRTGVRGRAAQQYDKFDTQDLALEKFRKFATERNVHITLVIHPRKEDENAKLSLASVFGSAKATQEADLVLVLQKADGRKSLEVKKNRYDGDLGEVYLYFEKESSSMRESKLRGATQKAP